MMPAQKAITWRVFELHKIGADLDAVCDAIKREFPGVDIGPAIGEAYLIVQNRILELRFQSGKTSARLNATADDLATHYAETIAREFPGIDLEFAFSVAADAAKSADKAANGIAQYIKNYLHSPGPTTWPAVHQALQLRAETGNLKARAIQDIWENEFIPPKRLTLAQFKARVARRQAELEKQ